MSTKTMNLSDLPKEDQQAIKQYKALNQEDKVSVISVASHLNLQRSPSVEDMQAAFKAIGNEPLETLAMRLYTIHLMHGLAQFL